MDVFYLKSGPPPPSRLAKSFVPHSEDWQILGAPTPHIYTPTEYMIITKYEANNINLQQSKLIFKYDLFW